MLEKGNSFVKDISLATIDYYYLTCRFFDQTKKKTAISIMEIATQEYLYALAFVAIGFILFLIALSCIFSLATSCIFYPDHLNKGQIDEARFANLNLLQIEKDYASCPPAFFQQERSFLWRGFEFGKASKPSMIQWIKR